MDELHGTNKHVKRLGEMERRRSMSAEEVRRRGKNGSTAREAEFEDEEEEEEKGLKFIGKTKSMDRVKFETTLGDFGSPSGTCVECQVRHRKTAFSAGVDGMVDYRKKCMETEVELEQALFQLDSTERKFWEICHEKKILLDKIATLTEELKDQRLSANRSHEQVAYLNQRYMMLETKLKTMEEEGKGRKSSMDISDDENYHPDSSDSRSGSKQPLSLITTRRPNSPSSPCTPGTLEETNFRLRKQLEEQRKRFNQAEAQLRRENELLRTQLDQTAQQLEDTLGKNEVLQDDLLEAQARATMATPTAASGGRSHHRSRSGSLYDELSTSSHSVPQFDMNAKTKIKQKKPTPSDDGNPFVSLFRSLRCW